MTTRKIVGKVGAIAAGLLALPLAAAETATVPAVGERVVLLDGACGDAEYAGAATIELGAGQTLEALRRGEELWLCIPVRQGGLATMDLYLVSPGEKTPLNLHVSAQIGERRLANGAWPDYAWWNHQRWSAFWVPFNGFEGEGAARRAKFNSTSGRELVLDLGRFGRGDWFWRLELRHVVDAEGKTRDVDYPAGSPPLDPAGWAKLRVP